MSTVAAYAAIDRHPAVLFTKAAGNTSHGTDIGAGAFAPEVYRTEQRRHTMLGGAAAEAEGERWEE